MRQAPFKGAGFPVISIGIFSVFVNLLMLTGPLFMLQIYDRVLGSRSEETLVALLVLVIALYVFMGILDYTRGRIAARIGATYQTRLDRQVFALTLAHPNFTVLKDIESVQRFLSSPAFLAMIDIPWTPIFILAIFTFHPLLGWLSLCGGLLIILIAIVNQITTRKPVEQSGAQTQYSDRMAAELQSQGDIIRGIGMQRAAEDRWLKSRGEAMSAQITSSDRTGSYTTLSKTFRLFLQSAILALGAYLVLQDQMTAGAMIASSILMGRALAPIEQTVGNWPLIQRAIAGRRNLSAYLKKVPKSEPRTPLPRPQAKLEVSQLAVVPAGATGATLRGVSFHLAPGQALGVIGPSASGKTTLARALTGIWPPASGAIRLGGAKLEQYGDDLGQHIGYLPQDVTLFDATVAENIAKLAVKPDPEAVVKAAMKAGAHDTILSLPDGYDTRLSSVAGRLSGGQKQRIGLARAMYGNPVLLILDEPNSNLDSEGSNALNRAIRDFKAEGGGVIIMAHRPSGIVECETLMVMQGGVVKAFGARDEVLKAQLQNYADVNRTVKAGES